MLILKIQITRLLVQNDRWYNKRISNEAKIMILLSVKKKLTCKNYLL
jgi:hypothetical protein